MVNSLYGANDIRFELFRQDYQLPAKKQYELLLELDYTINFSIEWFLEHGEYKIALKDRGAEYRAALAQFIDNVEEKYIKKIAGENAHLNRFFSLQDYIRLALTIISVKEATHQDFIHVANLFFTATTDLDIFFITDTIKVIHAENEWEERLKTELEKEAFETIFHIIELIMNFKRANESIEDAYKAFVAINEAHYTLYLQDLKNLKTNPAEKFTPLTVVINSLKKIIHAKS
jgi:glutamate dehydrogenase